MSSHANLFMAIKVVSVTIIASFTLYVIYTFGQGWERRFFPVVSRLEITKMERVNNETTRIWVQFEKFRECRPLQVYWYRGRRDRVFDRVQFYVEKPFGEERPFANRPLGKQNSGPWLVHIPIDEMKTNAFSDAQNDCVPVWTSVSRFYN